MTEREYQQRIWDTAMTLNWRGYHVFDSRRSVAGFPDLCLVKNGRLLFLEVKSQNGRIRPEQVEWLADLNSVPGVDARVTRPSDWPTVLQLLGG